MYHSSTALKAKASIAALAGIDNTGFTDFGAVAGVSLKLRPVSIAGIEPKITYKTGISTIGKFPGIK